MKNILFVCQGNIGRSQIAEGFAKYFFGGVAYFYSAGIDDVGYKYNYRPYGPIIEIMKNTYNIDISYQKVKPINEEYVKKSDICLVLCSESECENPFPDYLKLHRGFKQIIVGDPNNKTLDDIEVIIKLIHDIVLSKDIRDGNY